MASRQITTPGKGAATTAPLVRPFDGATTPLVIPAHAGISWRKGAAANPVEIPAFAGMTK